MPEKLLSQILAFIENLIVPPRNMSQDGMRGRSHDKIVLQILCLGNKDFILFNYVTHK